MSEQLEGRNPILECLIRGKRKVLRIELDQGAKPEPRLNRIMSLAKRRKIPVQFRSRKRLDQLAEQRVHNGIIAQVEPLVAYSTKSLLDELAQQGREPFIVLADGLSYEHNLGAVLRSCLGFGAHALIVPTRRGSRLTAVAQRVSMGACEEVPVIFESLFSAIKQLKKAGVQIIGADMHGKPASEVNLKGPLALVMGAEGRGLSSQIIERCSGVVQIPLAGKLESLNVSVAAGVLMYERARQIRADR